MLANFSVEKSRQFRDAAMNGNLEDVKALSVDPEVDLDYSENGGLTPFIYACLERQNEVALYLLNYTERSIDYNKRNKFGITAMTCMCCEGDCRMVATLINSEKIILNGFNHFWEHPLWVAACHGQVEIVKILLLCGLVNTSILPRSGPESPITVARSKGHERIALLIEQNIDHPGWAIQ